MANLTPDITPQVLEACQANLAEVQAAFARGLDAQVKLAVGAGGPVEAEALPKTFAGAGLVVVLTVGETAALLLVPEESGVLPAWCAAPDPTGQSKLTTLAQELGMLLLPEQYMPDDFKAAHVKILHGAIARGVLAAEASQVTLEMQTADGRSAAATLLWPVSKPAAVLGSAAPKPAAPPKPAPKPACKPAAKSSPGLKSAGRVLAPAKRQAPTVESLPTYARSLLRIRVPVIVTLAQKRQPLNRIIELGPGSIIQFDKSCEEMLELDVGGRPVATGEAVKVGDKFGLRITSVILPEERFKSVKSAPAAKPVTARS